MPVPSLDDRYPSRSAAWKWWVCGLLLLATMINYMDRLTLNQTATRIKEELQLNNQGYGRIEFGFGVAFAVGALFLGRAADRWSVHWLYPLALVGWSAAGFVTGFTQTFVQLFLCRAVLGFFESGNWPCALRATQHILRPDERTMGNGILQSGAAIGAMLTPLIVALLVAGPGTWRYPFFVIGVLGTLWVVVWMLSVGRQDLAIPCGLKTKQASHRTGKDLSTSRLVLALRRELQWLPGLFANRRFWILVVLVVAINLTWHFFRVWLPLYLEEYRGYDRADVQWFSMAYYLATDAGSLSAGFAALWLVRRGLSVHQSRVVVFAACSVLAFLSFAVAQVQSGLFLIGLLLLLGFGALGLFPVYYSLSQELTVKDQGKLTGMLGFTTWMVSAAMHPLVGQWLDETKDWTRALGLAGLPPLIGLVLLLFLWGKDTPSR